MKLQLVSHPLCPYVHRSLITLLEKSVPHELTYIDLANKPDWFRAISPRGKIPLLVVDGTVLFESGAINEFLDETFAPQLLAESALARAQQRAWIEVANDLFAAHWRLISAAAGDVAAAQAALDGVLATFEAALPSPLFGNDTLTLVDVAVAPAFYRLAVAESLGAAPLLARFPKVAAWAQRTAARPSTTQAVPPDFAARYLAFLRERGGQFAQQLKPA